MEKKINVQITDSDYKTSKIGVIIASIVTLAIVLFIISTYMELSEVPAYAWVGIYIVSELFYLWFASPQAVANSRAKSAKKMAEEIEELKREQNDSL